MTARSKRTDEIRARLEAFVVMHDPPAVGSRSHQLLQARDDARYLLARVDRLEEILRNVHEDVLHNEGEYLDLFERIDAALGET